MSKYETKKAKRKKQKDQNQTFDQSFLVVFRKLKFENLILFRISCFLFRFFRFIRVRP